MNKHKSSIIIFAVILVALAVMQAAVYSTPLAAVLVILAIAAMAWLVSSELRER